MGSLGEPGIQSAQYERNGGVVMKKLMLGFLALTLVLWVVAGTQASAQQSAGQQSQTDQNQASQNQAKSNNGEMSGNVSSNGKTFTSDKNNKDYRVDNPDALKGHEGQHVAVIVHVDPDTGVIHIMQVEAPPQP
jgi:sulfite reductase alpha subunit-like flavoprotein